MPSGRVVTFFTPRVTMWLSQSDAQRQQLFAQELVEGVHVGGDDAQDVVLAAGDGGALHHLGPLADRRLEPLQVLGGGQVQLDDGVDLEVQAQLGRVQQGDAAHDQPLVLQSLDAAPAGRGRQADPVRHVRDRQARVVLQDVQDAGVDGVQLFGQGVSPNDDSAQ